MDVLGFPLQSFLVLVEISNVQTQNAFRDAIKIHGPEQSFFKHCVTACMAAGVACEKWMSVLRGIDAVEALSACGTRHSSASSRASQSQKQMENDAVLQLARQDHQAIEASFDGAVELCLTSLETLRRLVNGHNLAALRWLWDRGNAKTAGGHSFFDSLNILLDSLLGDLSLALQLDEVRLLSLLFEVGNLWHAVLGGPCREIQDCVACEEILT